MLSISDNDNDKVFYSKILSEMPVIVINLQTCYSILNYAAINQQPRKIQKMSQYIIYLILKFRFKSWSDYFILVFSLQVLFSRFVQ